MRKGKHIWLEQGLRLLAEGGLSALTVDALSAALGLTKGSFYHHFEGIRDLELQLLELWVDQQLAELPRLPKEPAQSLRRLDEWVAGLCRREVSVEPAMRAWSQQDAVVRREVGRVDSTRRKFLQAALEQLLDERPQPGMLADMLLAMVTGCLSAGINLPDQRMQELYAELKRIYGLEKMAAVERQTRLPI